MNHFTVGHFLYFMGAIEGLAVVVMGIAVMNGRMPAADGTASARTRGLILIFAGVATAIALCLFATFAEIAKQPIF